MAPRVPWKVLLLRSIHLCYSFLCPTVPFLKLSLYVQLVEGDIWLEWVIFFPFLRKSMPILRETWAWTRCFLLAGTVLGSTEAAWAIPKPAFTTWKQEMQKQNSSWMQTKAEYRLTHIKRLKSQFCLRANKTVLLVRAVDQLSPGTSYFDRNVLYWLCLTQQSSATCDTKS